MSRQHQIRFSADADRAASSASSRDAMRVRSVMTGNHPETQDSHSYSSYNAGSYSPTRQAKQVATVMVIGVVLLMGALLYALRSGNISALMSGKSASNDIGTYSDNPATITDRSAEPVLVPEQQVTAQENAQTATITPAQSAQQESGHGHSMSVPTPSPIIPTPLPLNNKPETMSLENRTDRSTTQAPGVTVAPTTTATQGNAVVESGADTGDNSTTSVPEAMSSPTGMVSPIPAADHTANTVYGVQVGATADKNEADQLALDLRKQRIANVAIEPSVRDGKTLYRVRFGTFTSPESARSAAERTGYNDAWIVKRLNQQPSGTPAKKPATVTTTKPVTPPNKVPLMKKALVTNDKAVHPKTTVSAVKTIKPVHATATTKPMNTTVTTKPNKTTMKSNAVQNGKSQTTIKKPVAKNPTKAEIAPRVAPKRTTAAPTTARQQPATQKNPMFVKNIAKQQLPAQTPKHPSTIKRDGSKKDGLEH